MDLIGADMGRKCSQKVYQKIGLGTNPDSSKITNHFDVVELHDCFSANELCTYESLNLCPTGHAGHSIDRGDFTYGGKVIVNPSGGLISKGHPLGATGLAQCAELCWQLQGRADKRQVVGAKMALQHNLGLGGACVVAAYKKYNQARAKAAEGAMTSDPEKLDGYEQEKEAHLVRRVLDEKIKSDLKMN